MKKVRDQYRIYPTTEQRAFLARQFGCVRYVFNWGLSLQREALDSKEKRPNMNALSKKLTVLKKSEETAFLKEVASIPLQQTLRHLDSAWARCFKRLSGRPRFKRKQSVQSASYTRSGFRLVGKDLFLGKIKTPIRVQWSREVPLEATTCTIILDRAGRYFATFVVERDIQPLPKLDTQIGIDLGLEHYLITSEGEKVGNPRFLRKDLDKLKRAQRALSKKQKGSKNREKARLKVARIHARIADRRKDFLNKLSTKLIRENQTICVESLSVKNMVKNHNLALSISDVGWGSFVQMLTYKADWYGRNLVKIDRWFPSSKLCSSCGHKNDKLPLSVRKWQCPSCSTEHDRDINAAVNIKAAGLAVIACGEETPGPERLRARVQVSSSKQEV